jgi:hypothetical protein
MTDLPILIRRRLDDPERSLLCRLAVQVVVEQGGVDETEAVEVLETFAERGRVHCRGDFRDAYLLVDDKVIVHATREWLAFHAHFVDEAPEGAPLDT